MLGLGPAIFLVPSGLTTAQAGRVMDRVGRIPVCGIGAILGPTVFGPLFAGKDVEADALTLPWLVR